MLSTNEIKFLTSLGQKKYRQSEGYSVIEHAKVILEPDLRPFWQKIYVTGEFMAQHPEFTGFKNLEVITDKEMAKISQQTTPPGILASFKIVPPADFSQNSMADLVLWIDGLQDPGNLGTIIRTAEWFGVKNIFLSPDCAEIANPKTVAATMGAFWRVNLYADSDLIALAPRFKQMGYQIIATTLDGDENLNLKTEKTVLIIGGEARGVSADLLKEVDSSFKIPGFGQSESLNAAVAAGIVLYKVKGLK